MQKFLVIQTAFIGDVVLATALIEKLHARFPEAGIDFLVRKGNEGLLTGHPWLHDTLVWDKRRHKLRNLFAMARIIRHTRYDKVINVQRYAATGLLTVFSGAKETIGFDKNPLSRWFTHRIPHIISAPVKPGAIPPEKPIHEIQRNQALISAFTDDKPARPRLYPAKSDEDKVAAYKSNPYITISPASVWFTKQYPGEKWAAFMRQVPPEFTIYLLGAGSDQPLCDGIANASGRAVAGTAAEAALPGAAGSVVNLAGRLNFLQSAALMRDAAINYVNDSAPLHFASAVNAPVTAVYCSTLPAFGFGPLSDRRYIVEVEERLDCRPCGLHGFKACPLGHFKCARQIHDRQLLQTLITSRGDGR